MPTDDTTPPTLEAISFSASSIDVDNGETAITVTARFTDDLSGIFDGRLLDGLGLFPQIQLVSSTGSRLSKDNSIPSIRFPADASGRNLSSHPNV